MEITENQLERILRKAVDYGRAMGAEGALIAEGKLPRFIRKSTAMKRLGKVKYHIAVHRGDLIEKKADPTKKNSPIVVDRKQVIYIEKLN